MFLAAGAVLLALNYALVERGLHRQAGAVRVQLGPGFDTPVVGDATFVRPAPGPGQVIISGALPLDDVLERFEAELRAEALHQLVVQSGLALGLMALASVGLGWV